MIILNCEDSLNLHQHSYNLYINTVTFAQDSFRIFSRHQNVLAAIQNQKCKGLTTLLARRSKKDLFNSFSPSFVFFFPGETEVAHTKESYRNNIIVNLNCKKENFN